MTCGWRMHDAACRPADTNVLASKDAGVKRPCVRGCKLHCRNKRCNHYCYLSCMRCCNASDDELTSDQRLRAGRARCHGAGLGRGDHSVLEDMGEPSSGYSVHYRIRCGALLPLHVRCVRAPRSCVP